MVFLVLALVALAMPKECAQSVATEAGGRDCFPAHGHRRHVSHLISPSTDGPLLSQLQQHPWAGDRAGSTC